MGLICINDIIDIDFSNNTEFSLEPCFKCSLIITGPIMLRSTTCKSEFVHATVPRGTRSAVVVRAAGRKGKQQPQLLSRVEELKLLSQIEQSGLLSRLEKQGVTLSGIEKAGLLTKAENLGLLSAASSPGTPTLLYTLAIFGVAAAATLVYLVPDNSFGEVAVQLVGAGVLVGAGGAAFYGGNLISSLQKAI